MTAKGPRACDGAGQEVSCPAPVSPDADGDSWIGSVPAVPAAVVVAEAAVPAVPVAALPAVAAVAPAAAVVMAPAATGVREVPRVGGDGVVRTVGGPGRGGGRQGGRAHEGGGQDTGGGQSADRGENGHEVPLHKGVVRMGDRSAARPHPAIRTPVGTGDARAPLRI